MNCYNHPTEIAVAQCAHCGKGLCKSCVKTSNPILCNSCYLSYKQKVIKSSIIYLGLYLIFFIIGYKLNFMSYKGGDYTGFFSGYILMSLISGRQFIHDRKESSVTVYDGMAWLMLLIIKVGFYILIGMVILPYNVIKTTINLIEALKK